MRIAKETAVSGETAFNLYATYGLPLEITRDLVKQWNFTVDEAGYTEARRLHAVASGSGAFNQYETSGNVYGDLLHALHDSGQLEGGVDHDPYTGSRMGSEIVGIVRDGESVNAISAGEKAEIITAATPFYVESGGEVSDTGQIIDAESGAIFTVTHTHRPVPGLIVHIGTATGDFTVGNEVNLEVENGRRSDIRRNHTATHLLHRELRAHLGKHVTQQGSLVAPDRLRFDFSHGEAVDKATLAAIEADINAAIMENMPVKLKYMGQKEAVNAGAMALFGEKYGDIVRTVTVGDGEGADAYSMELCGGLHVAETNDIGQFRFISEGSAAAGVRRVEAVTGRGAQHLISERLHTLDRVAALLNAPIAEMEARLESLLTNHHSLQKEMEKAQRKLARAQFTELLAQMQTVKGVPVLTAQIEGADVDTLREMTDWFKDKVGSGTAVLATVNNGKPIIIAAVTDDLIKRGIKAGDIVREVAKMVGGGGGGRPNLAQAGGHDASKLPEALAHVAVLVAEAIQ
jgi:alanyl-tRNA synthetase